MATCIATPGERFRSRSSPAVVTCTGETDVAQGDSAAWSPHGNARKQQAPPRLPGWHGLDPAVAGERPQSRVPGHRLDDRRRVKIGHDHIVHQGAAQRSGPARPLLPGLNLRSGKHPAAGERRRPSRGGS